MFNPFAKKAAPARVLALYEDPDTLLRAAALVRAARLHQRRRLHALSGPRAERGARIRKSWIPYVTLSWGSPARASALVPDLDVGVRLADQRRRQADDLAPAFIPVTFEAGVLIGGTMTLAALLVACGSPISARRSSTRDLTHDRFAIFIPESAASGTRLGRWSS